MGSSGSTNYDARVSRESGAIHLEFAAHGNYGVPIAICFNELVREANLVRISLGGHRLAPQGRGYPNFASPLNAGNSTLQEEASKNWGIRDGSNNG